MHHALLTGKIVEVLNVRLTPHFSLQVHEHITSLPSREQQPLRIAAYMEMMLL